MTIQKDGVVEFSVREEVSRIFRRFEGIWENKKFVWKSHIKRRTVSEPDGFSKNP